MQSKVQCKIRVNSLFIFYRFYRWRLEFWDAQMLRGSADIKHKTEKYKSQGQAKTSENR